MLYICEVLNRAQLDRAQRKGSARPDGEQADQTMADDIDQHLADANARLAEAQKAKILELEASIKQSDAIVNLALLAISKECQTSDRLRDANADLQHKNKALQDENKALQDENKVLEDEVSRLERDLRNAHDEILDAYGKGYDDAYDEEEEEEEQEEEEQEEEEQEEEQEEEEQDEEAEDEEAEDEDTSVEDDKLRKVLVLAASRGRWESEEKYVVEGCFRVLMKEIKVAMRRYTQSSIADSLGVHRKHVSNWVLKYPAGNPFRTNGKYTKARLPPREMKDLFEGHLTALKGLQEAPEEHNTTEGTEGWGGGKVPESFFKAYALLKEAHQEYGEQNPPLAAIYYDCWPNPGTSVRLILKPEGDPLKVTRIQRIETWRKCQFLSKFLIWLHDTDADEFRRCTAIPWVDDHAYGRTKALDPNAVGIYAQRFQRHKEEFLGPFVATLREELGALTTSMLKHRAIANKISRQEIDKTDDADDTRGALIDMIVAAETPN
eukprot:SAG22_NODE_46_length_24705_cov_89.861010_7_plen_494_part_00